MHKIPGAFDRLKDLRQINPRRREAAAAAAEAADAIAAQNPPALVISPIDPPASRLSTEDVRPNPRQFVTTAREAFHNGPRPEARMYEPKIDQTLVVPQVLPSTEQTPLQSWQKVTAGPFNVLCILVRIVWWLFSLITGITAPGLVAVAIVVFCGYSSLLWIGSCLLGFYEFIKGNLFTGVSYAGSLMSDGGDYISSAWIWVTSLFGSSSPVVMPLDISSLQFPTAPLAIVSMWAGIIAAVSTDTSRLVADFAESKYKCRVDVPHAIASTMDSANNDFNAIMAIGLGPAKDEIERLTQMSMPSPTRRASNGTHLALNEDWSNLVTTGTDMLEMLESCRKARQGHQRQLARDIQEPLKRIVTQICLVPEVMEKCLAEAEAKECGKREKKGSEGGLMDQTLDNRQMARRKFLSQTMDSASMACEATQHDLELANELYEMMNTEIRLLELGTALMKEKVKRLNQRKGKLTNGEVVKFREEMRAVGQTELELMDKYYDGW